MTTYKVKCTGSINNTGKYNIHEFEVEASNRNEAMKKAREDAKFLYYLDSKVISLRKSLNS